MLANTSLRSLGQSFSICPTTFALQAHFLHDLVHLRIALAASLLPKRPEWLWRGTPFRSFGRRTRSTPGARMSTWFRTGSCRPLGNFTQLGIMLRANVLAIRVEFVSSTNIFGTLRNFPFLVTFISVEQPIKQQLPNLTFSF